MKKKQISIVLECEEYFDSIGFLNAVNNFVEGYNGIEVVGTHIKSIKPLSPK